MLLRNAPPNEIRSSLSNRRLNAAEIASPSAASERACGKTTFESRLFRDDSHKQRNEDCYTFESLTGDPNFSALSSSTASALKRI
jgi:hypothetical protein